MNLLAKKSGYSNVLDSMRGIAVLCVFLSHTSGRGMAITPWLNFHGIGHIGVYLFFVLSGFLLTRNLLREQAVHQFFVRRFFRIVPLYFFVLVAVILYQKTGYYSPTYLHIEGGWKEIFLHFLFLRGDGLFWTLAAEFSFYLLLPLLVLLISRFGKKWLVFAAVVYFLWFVIIQMGGGLIPLKFVIINQNSQYLDVFICGILAAYVKYKLPEKIISIIFWGLLILTLFCVAKNFLGVRQVWFSLRWISLLYGVVFGLAVVSATQGNMGIIMPLQNRFLAFVGTTGFGWYLIHFPVLQIVNFSFGDSSPSTRFCISFLVVSLFAYIVFSLIERPGIIMGRRFELLLGRIVPPVKCKTSIKKA